MALYFFQQRAIHRNNPQILGPFDLLLRSGDIPDGPGHLLAIGSHNSIAKLRIDDKLPPGVLGEHKVVEAAVGPGRAQAVGGEGVQGGVAAKELILILIHVICVCGG
jgi:hypothetical protein